MKTTILIFSSLILQSYSATITWSAVQEITGDTTEIIDTGEDSSINTVTIFDLDGYNLTGPDPISDVSGTGGDITTSSGLFTSTDYDSALNSFDYNFADILSSGLEVGETYYIQFFYSDQRHDAYDNRTMIFDDGNGNSATLSSDGQYVIGEFVADGTSQELNITGGVSEAHLNLIVFATTSSTAPGVGTDNNPGTTVPEPSSMLLLLLGTAGLLSKRTR